MYVYKLYATLPALVHKTALGLNLWLHVHVITFLLGNTMTQERKPSPKGKWGHEAGMHNWKWPHVFQTVVINVFFFLFSFFNITKGYIIAVIFSSYEAPLI